MTGTLGKISSSSKFLEKSYFWSFIVFILTLVSMLFRSAKDADDKIKAAKRKGEALPSEKRFDSNCITPGLSWIFLPY